VSRSRSNCAIAVEGLDCVVVPAAGGGDYADGLVCETDAGAVADPLAHCEHVPHVAGGVVVAAFLVGEPAQLVQGVREDEVVAYSSGDVEDSVVELGRLIVAPAELVRLTELQQRPCVAVVLAGGQERHRALQHRHSQLRSPERVVQRGERGPDVDLLIHVADLGEQLQRAGERIFGLGEAALIT
jgi:hypothetical protein